MWVSYNVLLNKNADSSVNRKNANLSYCDIDELLIIFEQAAEAGNLDEIIRLFQFDNSRLRVRDGRGRTIAHQAAARNRINILQFVSKQEVGEFCEFISRFSFF